VHDRQVLCHLAITLALDLFFIHQIAFPGYCAVAKQLLLIKSFGLGFQSSATHNAGHCTWRSACWMFLVNVEKDSLFFLFAFRHGTF
jgi:hypothetical protein